MTNPQHAPINRLSLVLSRVSSSQLAHSHESIFQHHSNSITWYAYAVALPVSPHTCDFHNFFITFSKAWMRYESHTIWRFTYMLKVETIQIRWAQQHIFPSSHMWWQPTSLPSSLSYRTTTRRRSSAVSSQFNYKFSTHLNVTYFRAGFNCFSRFLRVPKIFTAL